LEKLYKINNKKRGYTTMLAEQKIDDYKKEILKYRKQLSDFDAQVHKGTTWQDIIFAKNPESKLEKWSKEKKSADLSRAKIEERLLQCVIKFRKKKLAEIASLTFKHYCSICLIIRDENEYLEEWLRWHIGQGIEHFYLYDHGSKIPVAIFLKKLPKKIQAKITVIDFSGTHENAQLEAYADCLKNFKLESRWIGFVDADEMVRVKCNKTMVEFLKEYEEFAGIMANWVLYGANGQVKKSNKPLRERFTTITPIDDDFKLGKVFVQPLLMQSMVIHNGYTLEGFDIVDENKQILPQASVGPKIKTTNLICIDHYFTKSYEEWLEKMKRGSCDPSYYRRYNEFFNYNPDMLYCREDINLIQEYEVSNK